MNHGVCGTILTRGFTGVQRWTPNARFSGNTRTLFSYRLRLHEIGLRQIPPPPSLSFSPTCYLNRLRTNTPNTSTIRAVAHLTIALAMRCRFLRSSSNIREKHPGVDADGSPPKLPRGVLLGRLRSPLRNSRISLHKNPCHAISRSTTRDIIYHCFIFYSLDMQGHAVRQDITCRETQKATTSAEHVRMYRVLGASLHTAHLDTDFHP